MVAGNIPATIHDVPGLNIQNLLINGYLKIDDWLLVVDVIRRDDTFCMSTDLPQRWYVSYQIILNDEPKWNGECYGDITQCHAAAIERLNRLISVY